MNKNEEKEITVYATGWKGFYPGLICSANRNSRQYKVGEIAEEKGGNICSEGMLHFCHKHPLDVFEFYPPATSKGISEYAIVEAHAPIQESNKKAATTKLKVVAKLDLAGICQLAVDFVFSKTKNKRKQLATGEQGAASATGNYGAASATGNYGAASATGEESFAFATGFQGKVKGSIGSWIGCAEYALNKDGLYHPVDFKVVRVDGKTIKEDVFYRLQNGEFVEVKEGNMCLYFPVTVSVNVK